MTTPINDAQGLLFVYSEPGPNVPEDRFNAWYDTEHLPLLSSIVPGILGATRYKAVDGRTPSWLALYELTSPSAVSSDLAQKAAAAASENELDIKANLAMLNRRVFSLRRTKIRSEVAGLPDLPEDATKPPSKFVCVVMMKPSEQKSVDDIIKWYDGEHMDLFARTPGWIRGRLYELVAGPMEGAGKPDPAVSPNLSVTFLALHEFSTVEGIGGKEMLESIGTPWAKEVIADVGPNLEQRLFGYYSQFVKEI